MSRTMKRSSRFLGVDCDRGGLRLELEIEDEEVEISTLERWCEEEGEERLECVGGVSMCRHADVSTSVSSSLNI